MKATILFYFFITLGIIATAQTASGDIEDYVGDIIDNMPGSTGDDYSLPTNSELNTWNTVLDYIMVHNLTDARSNAATLNYQVTEFTDTTLSPNQTFYVLEEDSPQSKYWGVYVFSKTPNRKNLIIAAPHSKYDSNTGKQSVFCFKNNMAKAVFINGTHRCNSSSFSSCSGSTSACGSGSEDFRESDLAHNTNSVFQKTTENLFNSISNSVFIQLHGFTKGSSDPYVIMSNGTRVTPTSDYIVSIRDALLNEDSSLTFKIAHLDTSWTRLIGFTNTQGRLINSSSDFCNTSATTTSGRFIHIEQEKTLLRSNETVWSKMSNALENVFPETCSDIIDDDFESGFGNWNDGGGDAYRSILYANSGTYSIRIRDNSGAASSMYTDALDLSSYGEVFFNFSFISYGMESGEDFFLEVSNDGGSSYSIVTSWAEGSEFFNGVRVNESVTVSGPFESNTVFRLRCDASVNNDTVYIDDVVITDCTSQNSSKSNSAKLIVESDVLEKSVNIFPNPASRTLFVKLIGLNQEKTNISVFNISGLLVKKIEPKEQANAVQEIDLDNLSNGVYIIRITDDNDFVVNKRIVISK